MDSRDVGQELGRDSSDGPRMFKVILLRGNVSALSVWRDVSIRKKGCFNKIEDYVSLMSRRAAGW